VTEAIEIRLVSISIHSVQYLQIKIAISGFKMRRRPLKSDWCSLWNWPSANAALYQPFAIFLWHFNICIRGPALQPLSIPLLIRFLNFSHYRMYMITNFNTLPLDQILLQIQITLLCFSQYGMSTITNFNTPSLDQILLQN